MRFQINESLNFSQIILAIQEYRMVHLVLIVPLRRASLLEANPLFLKQLSRTAAQNTERNSA